MKKIFVKAQDDLNFQGSITTLRRIIKTQLGYKFKRCANNRSKLIQRPNIKAWCAKYLRRIRQNDALGADKKPVIYLDETWIHSHYTVAKCWRSSETTGVLKNTSAGPRWIIAHAGGETGFVDGAFLMFKAKSKTGDYHDQMNGDNFMKWLTQQLLPNMPKNCLVVIDNAPYHSFEENKPPTMNARKAELQAWLSEQNVQFDHDFTKAELYELIKKHKPPKNYVVDNMFASHGHEVLRLPPYNCDLNPIEYIWHLIKRRVADKNVSQLASEIEAMTREAVASITVDDWKREVNHVKRIEANYAEIERLEDDDFSFIINTGNYNFKYFCNK